MQFILYVLTVEWKITSDMYLYISSILDILFGLMLNVLRPLIHLF